MSQNNFESYIQQLQNLEQSDNKAALSSFCILNQPVLSFFKNIWEPLQSILNAPIIDLEIISDVKLLLPELAQIKEEYEFLKKSSVGQRDEVKSFQNKIDMLTSSTCHATLLELQQLKKDLISSTNQQKDGANNVAGALMSGFKSQEEVLYAEKHLEESQDEAFFIQLINNTNKLSVLNRIYRHITKTFPASSKERINVLYALVRHKEYFERKSAAIRDLISFCKTKASLMELLNYIPYPGTYYFPSAEWAEQMVKVSGVTNDEAWTMIRKGEKKLYPFVS